MRRGSFDGFFRTLGRSFSFFEYEDLCEKKVSSSVKYFLKLMLFATILMFIVAIPAFLNFSSNIDKVINNFEALSIKINASSKGPIVLFPGDRHRETTIHWESNATELEEGKYLIAKDRLVKKSFFGSQYTNLSGYSNVLEHKDFYKTSLMILMAFLIPSMIVGAYVFFGIKFFIMLTILAAAGFMIMRIIRFDIDFKHCLNIAVYASTIGVIIAMAVFPYNIKLPYFRLEWVGYALSVMYFIVGLRYAGYFEERKDRERELERRRRYVPIREREK